jgi:hypothetical protein
MKPGAPAGEAVGTGASVIEVRVAELAAARA